MVFHEILSDPTLPYGPLICSFCSLAELARCRMTQRRGNHIFSLSFLPVLSLGSAASFDIDYFERLTEQLTKDAPAIAAGCEMARLRSMEMHDLRHSGIVGLTDYLLLSTPLLGTRLRTLVLHGCPDAFIQGGKAMPRTARD